VFSVKKALDKDKPHEEYVVFEGCRHAVTVSLYDMAKISKSLCVVQPDFPLTQWHAMGEYQQAPAQPFYCNKPVSADCQVQFTVDYADQLSRRFLFLMPTL
jgi:hypothetical protein